MSDVALRCIVCDKELKNVVSEASNQPYEGTAFITHGHYGSTIFDPMDGQFLEINVCDECLERAGNENKVLLSKSHQLVRDARNVVIGSEPVKDVGYVLWQRGLEG